MGLQAVQHDGQNGGDARARRKAHTVNRFGVFGHKSTIGRHHLQAAACLHMRGQPVGKHTIGHHTHTHFHEARLRQPLRRAANGITAAHIRAIHIGTQCDELSGLKSKCIAQCVRHRESNDHGLACFGAHGGHGQGMETGGSVHVNTV